MNHLHELKLKDAKGDLQTPQNRTFTNPRENDKRKWRCVDRKSIQITGMFKGEYDD